MKKYQHYEQIIFEYDSEEEKEKHSKEMKEQGYEDTGRKWFSKSFTEGFLCGGYVKYHK